jgi:hypothetical protein
LASDEEIVKRLCDVKSMEEIVEGYTSIAETNGFEESLKGSENNKRKGSEKVKKTKKGTGRRGKKERKRKKKNARFEHLHRLLR